MTQTSPYEITYDQTSNGHTAATGSPMPAVAVPSGPRIAKRYAWVDLPEDAYPGFKFRMWVNFPQRVGDQVQDAQKSGDAERMAAALTQIVVEHNGWCGEETGEPLPPASDPAFWSHPELPNELAQAVIGSIGLQVGKLATSLQTPRRTR